MEPDKGSRSPRHKARQASLPDEGLRAKGSGVRGAARRHIQLIILPVLLAPSLACLSCGYTASTTLPAHIKNIAIPVFKNETLEYSIEEELTNAVIEKFVTDNRLRVVGEKDAASVLVGSVKGYQRRVFSYSAGEVAQEYEVIIRVAVEFKDTSNGRIIWKDDSLVSSARYFAVDMAGQTAQTEQDGRKPAIEFLATDILTRTVEGW